MHLKHFFNQIEQMQIFTVVVKYIGLSVLTAVICI